MTADVPGWLVEEVSDLLEISSVGLYEFIWMLRVAQPAAREEDIRSWAAEGLRRLLQDEQSRLVLLRWPSEDVVGDGSNREISPDDWADPAAEQPYVAISRAGT